MDSSVIQWWMLHPLVLKAICGHVRRIQMWTILVSFQIFISALAVHITYIHNILFLLHYKCRCNQDDRCWLRWLRLIRLIISVLSTLQTHNVLPLITTWQWLQLSNFPKFPVSRTLLTPKTLLINVTKPASNRKL